MILPGCPFISLHLNFIFLSQSVSEGIISMAFPFISYVFPSLGIELTSSSLCPLYFLLFIQSKVIYLESPERTHTAWRITIFTVSTTRNTSPLHPGLYLSCIANHFFSTKSQNINLYTRLCKKLVYC